MAKAIIHVNQHIIRRNLKTGSRDPVITIKSGGKNRYCHSVKIHGPSEVIYSPDKPQSCGARVWIATESDLTLYGEVEGIPEVEGATIEPCEVIDLEEIMAQAQKLPPETPRCPIAEAVKKVLDLPSDSIVSKGKMELVEKWLS